MGNSVRFGLCCALILLVATAFAASASGEVLLRIDLPAQPLADSLRAVASQSNSNILFDPPLVAGRSAPALRAELSFQDALARLLAGTEIRLVFVNEHTVVLARPTPVDRTKADVPL